jgi:hypothetical protein
MQEAVERAVSDAAKRVEMLRNQGQDLADSAMQEGIQVLILVVAAAAAGRIARVQPGEPITVEMEEAEGHTTFQEPRLRMRVAAAVAYV